MNMYLRDVWSDEIGELEIGVLAIYRNLEHVDFHQPERTRLRARLNRMYQELGHYQKQEPLITDNKKFVTLQK